MIDGNREPGELRGPGQTVWRDPAARAASPGLAEMIRSEILAEEGCEIRTDEDYSLIFNSVRKATVPPE